MNGMKIYTRKGDEGKTSLLGGTRVDKHHLRIEAYGTVDELNSWMGFLRDHIQEEAMRDLINRIQDRLFTLGSHLANDDSNMQLPQITQDDVVELEQSIDYMDTQLEPLKNFILPGGHPANSIAHISRTICRRAERMVVATHAASPQPEIMLVYLNRLSDWLFTFARYCSKINNAPEIPWKPRGAS